MPINHRGRPPGRRADRRPGKGPALVPQHSKHAAALATVPTAQAYINELTAAGADQEKVDALQTLVAYARERAEQGIAKAKRDAATMVNKAIEVPTTFKTHVYAHAEDNTHVSTVVGKSLLDFVQGEWTPPEPQRAGRGQKPDSTNVNVRVDKALWEQANAHGKDPEQVAARGYKLTANQVAIAALHAAFPLPETAETTGGATA